MMQLLHLAGCHAGGHRLHALALARSKKPVQVDRGPAALLDPPEPSEERREPRLELGLPVGCGAGHHGTPREHHRSLQQTNLAE